MPCSAARRGYRSRMTSLGDLPDRYAFFKSLKSSDAAVMLTSLYRSPFGERGAQDLLHASHWHKRRRC